jgi:enoyl-[acyl-carrier protein] reductase III
MGEAKMRLKGKQALITGSSRGIGRGIALKLAEEGATIAVHYYRNHEAAADTLAQIREIGSDGIIIQADVSLVDDIRRMFAEIRDTFGTLDMFVSHARSDLATSFQIAVQEAAPLMPNGSRILATTGAPQCTSGLQPWIASISAKAALETSVRCVAVALAARGITVNAINPGISEDKTPIGRPGTPADIGNVVALLCYDEASWITGQVIVADGGASLMDTVVPFEMQLAHGRIEVMS